MAAASGTFSGRWVTPSGFSGVSGQGGSTSRLATPFWSYVLALRLPHYFRLGLVGFLGTVAWLAVPAILIAAGGRQPLLGVLGALVLAMIVPFLPFLQVHYAVEERVSALFS